MKIALVILNWNGKQLLEKFIPSVVNFSTLKNVEIYVNLFNNLIEVIEIIELTKLKILSKLLLKLGLNKINYDKIHF